MIYYRYCMFCYLPQKSGDFAPQLKLDHPEHVNDWFHMIKGWFHMDNFIWIISYGRMAYFDFALSLKNIFHPRLLHFYFKVSCGFNKMLHFKNIHCCWILAVCHMSV